MLEKKLNSCSRCKALFGDQASMTDKNDLIEVVSEETKNFIKKTYYSYLCNNCLKEINNLVEISKIHPIQGKKLIEGLHYYTENTNLMVFTELYHLSRGFCCQNACRHCAYGFKYN